MTTIQSGSTAGMRAITVQDWAQRPVFSPSASRPSLPTPGSGSIQLRVLASGLHPLIRSQSAGQHYTTKGTPLPYFPGADGVGIDSKGSLVYFNSITSGGGFAEYINILAQSTFPLDVPTLTTEEEKCEIAARVASLMNPAMSSWMALTTRTANLPENFTVLIMGVTSLSGQLAIRLARSLGAGKVIGVARSSAAMARLGLDEAVTLTDPVELTDFSILQRIKVDVVVDYIYGPATKHLINSLPSNPLTAHDNEVQYIQVGSLGGLEMDLSASLLRSKNLTMRGSGPGSWSLTKNVKEQYPVLLKKLVEGGLGEYAIQERKLEDVADVWDAKERIVFVV